MLTQVLIFKNGELGTKLGSAKQEINLKAGHKINMPAHLFEVISDEQINAEIEKLK